MRMPEVTTDFPGRSGWHSCWRCVYLVQTALQLLAGHAGLSQVDEHQVVVRAAADQIEALLLQCLREHARVGDDALLVRLELRFECLAEADCLCGDNVLERTALCAGEDGLVKLLCQFLIVRQDDAAAADRAASCAWWW